MTNKPDMSEETKSDDQSEMVELPMSACPDCKVGDTIELTATGIDSKTGMIQAKVNESEEDNGYGGSDAMAQDLNKPPQQS